MFEIIFLLVVSLYFLLTFYLLTGIKKQFPQANNAELPTAAIIVAARNEEKNILRCLSSLDAQIYPADKLEIIIVDDNSADSTGEIIDTFTHDKSKFKKIIPGKEQGNLKGKVNALAAGIREAKADIILLTDADCAAPPSWAFNTALYYSNDTGIVNGFTTQEVNNSFTGMQAIDFIYLISVASGMTNHGYPVSCIGNNMSFRKQAYLEAGGYESLPFSVTEDFALLNAVRELKKYRILHPINPETLITSIPCPSLKDLLFQKKRWAVGGINAPLIGKIIMAEAFLAGFFVLLTPLFFSPVSLYLAVFKITIDGFFLIPVHASLGIKNNLKYFFNFQLYYLLYVITLPLILIFSRKVKWKGREY
ncbi:MAG: glycosyltransferase [Ignavibacteriaceae bacterium]